MKSPYPGVSTRLIRWPFHSQYATAVLTEILRLISSGSKSVVVVPSSTLPRRLTAPVVKSIDSTSDVFPTPPWPTTPTFRILPISIAIHDLLPTSDWEGNANTGPGFEQTHDERMEGALAPRPEARAKGFVRGPALRSTRGR